MRRLLGACAALSAALAAAACSSDPPRLSSLFVRQVAHPPPGLRGPVGRIPYARWAGSTELYVVAGGSSGCPSLPTSVQAIGRHQVSVMTAAHVPSGEACPADLRPDVSLIRLPHGIDRHAPLTIEVDNNVTHLPAR